jgi:hypothetical protein
MLLRYEPARRTLADKDSFDVEVATEYGKDYVVLCSLGRQRRVKFSIENDTLTLTNEGGPKRVFRRMAAVPPELELKPLALGKQAELPDERIKTIRKELARRFLLDQDVRNKILRPPARNKTKSEADMKALQELCAKIDGDNVQYLKSLIGEIGWVDVPRFGEETSNAAFMIVQHSGHMRLMLAALPEIEKDVKAKRFQDGQPYALLYDRMHLLLGEKQRYGSQVGQNEEGEVVVLRLEDRARVDEFRKELGLMPLSTYLGFYLQMGAKGVVFEP